MIEASVIEQPKRGPGRPPNPKPDRAPEEAVPPQKNQDDVSKMEIRRFELADLQDWGNWIYGRLKEQPRYAHLNERMFPAWIRNWIVNNEMLFIRNDGAVALAEICRDSMQLRPWVREIFLYAKEGADDDGLALYRFILDWASQLGAIRAIVGEDTDITLEQIGAVGKVQQRKLSYIKLE